MSRLHLEQLDSCLLYTVGLVAIYINVVWSLIFPHRIFKVELKLAPVVCKRALGHSTNQLVKQRTLIIKRGMGGATAI